MIRPATADDVAALAALEQALFGHDAWSEALLRSTLATPHEHVWVAGDTSAYVVTMVAGDSADLMRIAVAPERRRQGLAAALLDTATEHARSAGAVRMLLEVGSANAGALAFYRAAGYTQIDVRAGYYADGSDALVLSRGLG